MDSDEFQYLDDASALLMLWIGVAAIISFIAPLAYVIFSWAIEPDWQREAIQRGYAIYCPGDGRFAWQGECGE